MTPRGATREVLVPKVLVPKALVDIILVSVKLFAPAGCRRTVEDRTIGVPLGGARPLYTI